MIDSTYELTPGEVVKHDESGNLYHIIAVADGKVSRDWTKGVIYQSESSGTWYWRSINSMNENFSLFFEETAG
jgi:hypothetical protein